MSEEKRRNGWQRFLDRLKPHAPKLVAAAAGLAGGPLAASAAYALARSVTGAPDGTDPNDLGAAILGDPTAWLEAQKLAVERERIEYELERAKLEAETARIEAVNATMRSEAGAGDPWVRRWRPFFGYASAIAFAVQMIGATVAALIGEPEAVASLSQLVGIWAPGLAVLGITSWTRGREKLQIAQNAASVAAKV